MRWGIWLLLIGAWTFGTSQTTIGVIDFDGSSNYIGYSITGASASSDSTNNTYGLGSVQTSGKGLEVKNDTVLLTSNSINTSSYSNISLSFRLASLFTNGDGSDQGDSVTLWISLDNGSTWSAEIKVLGRSQAKWSYDTAQGVAMTSFDGNGNATFFQPDGGGWRTSDGFGTIVLNSLPSVNNLKFRISIKNDKVDEIWAIDDIVLTGTSGNCTPATSVSAPSTTSHSFSLDAKWTNSSCYDEVVVFMNETIGIQVSPTGSYGSYFGNSVYSSINQCVYNGVGDSIRVTGLDNGTTYYFEIFTRRNSTWSSGVEVSGTPDFNGLTFNALNTVTTIDFDNNLAGVNNGVFNGSGFSPSPSTGQLNSSSWSVTGFSDGDCGFDSSKTGGDFARGASSVGVGTGGIYAFQVASGDYALGVQPVGADFTPGEFILRMANETGSTATTVLVNYYVYVRNDQGRSNSLNFAYSVDGLNYTIVNQLKCISNQTANTVGWRRNQRIVNLTGLSIQDNSFFYFKWIGNDEGGLNDRDEFALDNVSVSFHTSLPSSVTVSSSNLESLKVFNVPLTINANLQVDSISLSNSVLSIGNYDLTIIDSAFVGNDSSYIETNGTGKVNIDFAGDTTIIYPIGRSKFSPISLDFSSTILASGSNPATASVRVIDSVHSGVSASSSTNDYIKRFWNVTSSGLTSFSCNVLAKYNDVDIVGTEGNLFMGKWNGTVWDVGNSVNASSNELTISNVTSFSDFTGAGSPLLPVEWVYFKGERKEEFDVLEWATASQYNIQKYVVERSFDNVHFNEVFEELDCVNSNTLKYYKVAIPNKNNLTYYRVKSIDFDGKEDKYSTICIGNHSSLSYYYTENGIQFINPNSLPIEIKIIDVFGNVVIERKVEDEYFLENQALRGGTYFCLVNSDIRNTLKLFIR